MDPEIDFQHICCCLWINWWSNKDGVYIACRK